MSVFHSTCVVSNDFDLASARPSDVRFAFVIHLPFRLRLGDWYRHSLNVGSRHFTLCFLNRVSIPENTSPTAHPQVPFAQQYTEALVVLENPRVQDDALLAIRSAGSPEAIKEYPRSPSESFHAMEAINHFVIGYGTAAGQVFGGSPLRLFRTHDFTDHLRWEITVLGPSQEPLSDDDARQLLDLKPDREIGMVTTFTGELGDLPQATLRLIRGSIEHHRDFLFYEFAFEAKAKMVTGDYVGALLMAVAALEGAHAAYVTEVLAGRLPTDAGRQLTSDYLRQLGMSLCNKLTPYIFMDVAVRPSPDLVAQADKALQYRNDIMHALRNRSGEYRRRTRTNKELSDAYSAALRLFDCYRAAFEALRRSAPETGTN